MTNKIHHYVTVMICYLVRFLCPVVRQFKDMRCFFTYFVSKNSCFTLKKSQSKSLISENNYEEVHFLKTVYMRKTQGLQY